MIEIRLSIGILDLLSLTCTLLMASTLLEKTRNSKAEPRVYCSAGGLYVTSKHDRYAGLSVKDFFSSSEKFINLTIIFASTRLINLLSIP
jgi:hypothetical protein